MRIFSEHHARASTPFGWWVFCAIFLLYTVGMIGGHIASLDERASLSDPASYHSYAIQMVDRFEGGVFRTGDIYEWHWYPAVLGMLYAVTLPSMLMGKMLSVTLAALSAFLLFRLMREVGAESSTSFWCSLAAVGVYPAYLIFGTTLVKEVFIVPLVLAALWVTVRLLSNFTARGFFLLALLVGLTSSLRFMVGEVLIGAILLSLLVAAPSSFERRVAGVGILGFLLGAVVLVAGFGFLGLPLAGDIARPEYIEEYRYIAYSQYEAVSAGSTTGIEILREGVFSAGNFLYSLITVALGPFFWQVQKPIHLVAVVESVLWLGVVALVLSAVRVVAWRRVLPTVLFGGGWIVVVSLGSDNIGATMRYRMPAFLALSALAPLGVAVVQSNYARFLHHHKI